MIYFTVNYTDNECLQEIYNMISSKLFNKKYKTDAIIVIVHIRKK